MGTGLRSAHYKNSPAKGLAAKALPPCLFFPGVGQWSILHRRGGRRTNEPLSDMQRLKRPQSGMGGKTDLDSRRPQDLRLLGRAAHEETGHHILATARANEPQRALPAIWRHAGTDPGSWSTEYRRRAPSCRLAKAEVRGCRLAAHLQGTPMPISRL